MSTGAGSGLPNPAEQAGRQDSHLVGALVPLLAGHSEIATTQVNLRGRRMILAVGRLALGALAALLVIAQPERLAECGEVARPGCGRRT